MRAWYLDRPPPVGTLDLNRATGLVAALGAAETNAFAAAVLRLLGDVAAISQCTVFAYEAGLRPRTVAVADYRGGAYLREVADIYARRFYALDGNQQIVAEASPRKPGTSLTMHQQAIDDIKHEAYRAACYSGPNVSDRIALLSRQSEDVWLSVNLYRDRQYGVFRQDEIARLETLAPLVVHAAQQHYALSGQRQASIPQLMLARLLRHCPALSKRELDVLRGVLEGHTTNEIAELIGVKASSVTTYQKRAYRRLGISSQRQLFALCLNSLPA
ncbi:bacterial regulatory s, luxR family protein [Paraburkholderia xenovorans LB400]|jgi:DNA-binding CsgD family transcriptional regulator|uniref:Transcriptional regulator, LuxR family n=1 Tax=Paraburkholderia xenovorans (strain LB400) TaxID=266265 RepID=Q140K3_PARXL|nr:LuxR C-terminal-related transcriptional regulator [Paraburkholderia xenovorans]ABE30236.1 transcriptional regulator, LuxR family [Paraburkholderia xenovorans LB400]AIP33172.1 bacterial regulatory s, luxR family protein [Paraburkholderia xenovorans LB400]